MEVQIKKFSMCLALVAVLLFPIAQISSISAVSTNEEKAIGFLRDVAGLDMSKYRLTDARDIPTAGSKYTFTCDNGTFYVLCSFSEGELIACALFPESGSPLVAQPVTDALTTGRGFVDRYQSYSKASYVQQMRETLNMVSKLKVDSAADDRSTMKKSATASASNVTLTVWSGNDDSGDVLFDWMNTVNGIKNPYNVAGFGFSDGVFSSFADNWNLYPVGCDEVKVSRAQAVGLAVERLKSFSYSVGNVTVDNLVVAKDFAVFAEVSMQPRNGVLFPHWEIYLPLDRVYLGNVVSVRVMMWADTGEIDSMQASSTLGLTEGDDVTPTATPSSQTTSPSITPMQSSPTTSPSFTMPPTASTSYVPTDSTENAGSTDLSLWVVAAFAAVVGVVTFALFAKRRRG